MSREGVLIERAVAGDRHAFDELATAHRPDAVRLALALLGDPQEAEDVAQELLLRMSSALAGFRGDAELSTWAYRVTLNLCRDRLRRRRRRPLEVPIDTEAIQIRADGGPERELEVRRTRQTVERAVARLSAEQREVLRLRYAAELSYPEISRATGLAQGTVASRVFRALRRLGQELGAQNQEPSK